MTAPFEVDAQAQEGKTAADAVPGPRGEQEGKTVFYSIEGDHACMV